MPRFVRIAALALAGALAACSSTEAAAPVTLTSTPAPGSASSSSVMTAPLPSSTVPSTTETSTPPTLTPTTSTSSAAPETTATRPDNPTATSDADVVPLDPGTVVYHGTTYTMPPEETTKLADELIVTFDIAPGVDITGVDIKGAEKAYRGFVEVGDRATKQPGKNWRSEFSNYLNEPLLSAALSELRGMADRGVASIGHSAYYATVENAGKGNISVKVCNDTSGQDRIDVKSGTSVKAGGPVRGIQQVIIVDTGNKVWKLESVDYSSDAPC